MKKGKKIFIVFCVVTLIVSMFCVTAYAAGSGDVAGGRGRHMENSVTAD